MNAAEILEAGADRLDAQMRARLELRTSDELRAYLADDAASDAGRAVAADILIERDVL